MIFRASWLTLGMFSAALAGGATPPPALDLVFVVLGQVFSQLCQENPRTCRRQSRESKNLPRTKPRRKSVQAPKGKIKSQSFVLLNSFPYRNPPYSKNVGRRYSPQGGFNYLSYSFPDHCHPLFSMSKKIDASMSFCRLMLVIFSHRCV